MQCYLFAALDYIHIAVYCFYINYSKLEAYRPVRFPEVNAF